ncbi:MAG: cupin domain-containing protein [Armatimonadota bacterium]
MQKVRESDIEYRHGTHGPKYLFRGPHMEWGLIRLQPGDRMGQHGHRQTDEFFFVIEGTPTILADGERHVAQPGDAFYLTPEEMHDIVNEGDATTRLVFMKAPYNPTDKI